MKAKAPLTPELYVTDLQASLAFYVDVIGFRVEFDRPEQGFAALELGLSRLMLEQAPRLRPSTESEMQRGQWIPAQLEAPFGRGMNFEIEVEDVDAIHQRCQGRGLPLVVALHQKSYRVGQELCTVRQFLVADPDGYLIRPSQTLHPCQALHAVEHPEAG